MEVHSLDLAEAQWAVGVGRVVEALGTLGSSVPSRGLEPGLLTSGPGLLQGARRPEPHSLELSFSFCFLSDSWIHLFSTYPPEHPLHTSCCAGEEAVDEEIGRRDLCFLGLLSGLKDFLALARAVQLNVNAQASSAC